MKHFKQILGFVLLVGFIGFMFYKLLLARDSMSDSSHNAIMVLVFLFVTIVLMGVRKIIRE